MTALGKMMRWALVAGLLAGSASAFCVSALTSSSPTRRSAVRANEFDEWWVARRASNRVLQPGEVRSPMPTLETLELDGATFGRVLKEFVLSDYARGVFKTAGVQPTDYGLIEGMFSSVWLVEGGVEVRLKRAFDERNDALLDRLAKYCRARIPKIGTIYTLHRDGKDIY